MSLLTILKRAMGFPTEQPNDEYKKITMKLTMEIPPINDIRKVNVNHRCSETTK